MTAVLLMYAKMMFCGALTDNDTHLLIPHPGRKVWPKPMFQVMQIKYCKTSSRLDVKVLMNGVQ